MPKRGKAEKPNRKRHQFVCVMCGAAAFAARPDATTESNKCRSALRRWRKLYGAAPVNPPGPGSLKPMGWNREAFLRAYVDLPAYERHKKHKKKQR